jgi:hypothetical protein
MRCRADSESLSKKGFNWSRPVYDSFCFNGGWEDGDNNWNLRRRQHAQEFSSRRRQTPLKAKIPLNFSRTGTRTIWCNSRSLLCIAWFFFRWPRPFIQYNVWLILTKKKAGFLMLGCQMNAYRQPQMRNKWFIIGSDASVCVPFISNTRNGTSDHQKRSPT